LPDFLGTINQNGEKYTKMGTKITNGHLIYQIAIEIHNGHEIGTPKNNKIFYSKASQNIPKLAFLGMANITSGSPDFVHLLSCDCSPHGRVMNLALAVRLPIPGHAHRKHLDRQLGNDRSPTSPCQEQKEFFIFDVPARWLGGNFDITFRLPLYGRRRSLRIGLQPS
jgi:hypothetical protein